MRYYLNEGVLDMLLLLSMFRHDSNLHCIYAWRRMSLPAGAAGLSPTKECNSIQMQRRISVTGATI